MADDLQMLDEWFGRILAGLDPGKRKRAAAELGQLLRRSNLKRQQDNVEPDGTPMERRKPRLDRRGGLKGKQGGKMFKRLRMSRNFPIDADADGVEIAAGRGIERVAAEHHFGLVGVVGRSRDGRTIRTRYAARPLLGFSDDDRQLTLDVAAKLIDPNS